MWTQVFEGVLEHDRYETMSRRRELRLTSHIRSGVGGTATRSTRGAVKGINNQDPSVSVSVIFR